MASLEVDTSAQPMPEAGSEKMVRLVDDDPERFADISPYITPTRSAISSITPKLWRMKQHGQAITIAPIQDKLEDLRLDRQIECRYGLIGDDQLGDA
jgi:hypothetical protein